MSLDTDIICYIIGYIPVRPEIWSGAGPLPLCWAPALLLPSVVRYQALPGTVRCLPFLSQLRVGGPHLPGAARGHGQVRPAVSIAKSGRNTFITPLETSAARRPRSAPAGPGRRATSATPSSAAATIVVGDAIVGNDRRRASRRRASRRRRLARLLASTWRRTFCKLPCTFGFLRPYLGPGSVQLKAASTCKRNKVSELKITTGNNKFIGNIDENNRGKGTCRATCTLDDLIKGRKRALWMTSSMDAQREGKQRHKTRLCIFESYTGNFKCRKFFDAKLRTHWK